MPSPIDTHLGKAVRRRRRMMDLTQAQLAALVGVRFQQIQKLECATNAISARRLWQLAQALQVPVGYFYEGLSGFALPHVNGFLTAGEALGNTAIGEVLRLDAGAETQP